MLRSSSLAYCLCWHPLLSFACCYSKPEAGCPCFCSQAKGGNHYYLYTKCIISIILHFFRKHHIPNNEPSTHSKARRRPLQPSWWMLIRSWYIVWDLPVVFLIIRKYFLMIDIALSLPSLKSIHGIVVKSSGRLREIQFPVKEQIPYLFGEVFFGSTLLLV